MVTIRRKEMMYADNFCTYVEELDPKLGHVYIFTGPYHDDHSRKRSVVVPAAELYAYTKGALIQDAFPKMSADDREFLMSGMSPEFFKKGQ